MTLTKKQLLDILLRMYRIRLFEETIKRLYTEGFIRGPLHLYIGEEAVATGACSALRKEDYVVSTHRGHINYPETVHF